MRKTTAFWLPMVVLAWVAGAQGAGSKSFAISREILKDKIRGGWAGQTIGCTFGGPTEFKFRGTIIQDYQFIPWDRERMKWYYERSPGLYDDLYMDLTFVQVFENEGLDAPAASFAKAFAHAEYSLWHANQAGRYNILNGLKPPETGHWLNNPHADDIDFQIEADFAGLMSPGMVNTSAEICDKIGHIMNYGDGWYGGVYMAALYSLAFVENDIHRIAEDALKVIPGESLYAKVMAEVISFHKKNPDDWKAAWFNVQRRWSEDVGCPEGVFDAYNIDAKINSAWVLIGLLYGDHDFGKTVSIAARSGDDSDCNPCSAGGILGTLIGYRKIPEFWKQGLPAVEPMDFKYTTISLNRVYDLSMKHALELIRRNGGNVEGDPLVIRRQDPKPVRLEAGFEGHYPTERKTLNLTFSDKAEFEFEGIGFAASGAARSKSGQEYSFRVEMRIDGKPVETSQLPTKSTIRKVSPFWRYRLAPGKHKVEFVVLNPTDQAEIGLTSAILYDGKPRMPKY